MRTEVPGKRPERPRHTGFNIIGTLELQQVAYFQLTLDNRGVKDEKNVGIVYYCSPGDGFAR